MGKNLILHLKEREWRWNKSPKALKKIITLFVKPQYRPLVFMGYNILLNNEVCHIRESDLPCLVHYKEKAGGSYFTISLVVDLLLRGSKILFFTKYHMAKDNFLEQIKEKESNYFLVERKKDLVGAEKYNAIILKSGDENLYREALKSLTDLEERIVLVKNFEALSKNILNSSLSLEKIILSGDTDRCVDKKRIRNKLFKTSIMFSESEALPLIRIPELKKYTGYLKAANMEGLIELEN